MRFLLYALEAFWALFWMGLCWLLPRPWAHGVGRRLGGLAFDWSRRSRETALENLRLRLGVEGERAKRIGRASLMQAGAALMDLIRAPRITRRIVRRDLAIPEETRRCIDALRTSEKGGVLAGCHVGNWEFLNLAWPYLADPMMVIVRPPRRPFFRFLVDRLRAATGERIIHRTGGVRKCLRHVQRGGIAGIPFDLPVPPEAGARLCDLLGVETYTTMAPGYIAAKAGVPLYLLYTHPIGQQRYRLMLEPIEVDPALSPREAGHAAMQRLSFALERVIRDYPEGWAWWLKRWSIRPDGAPPEEWPAYSHHESHFLSGGMTRRD